MLYTYIKNPIYNIIIYNILVPNTIHLRISNSLVLKLFHSFKIVTY